MSENFWHSPPWKNGTKKYQLGLRPISLSNWLTSDSALWANKSHQLTRKYSEVVAEDSAFELPDSSQWSLPWKPRGDHSHWIARLGAGLAEDVCLIDLQRDQRLVAGCVAAPSYWSLREKLGKSIWDVHAPVQGMNARIGANIERFMAQVPVQTPFYRSNWFVHSTDHYYPEQQDSLAVPMANWFIRSEQQVLFRPEPRYLLFTIRVVFAGLAEVAHHQEARVGLLDALARMDPNEIAHFGGVVKHQHLTEYVAQLEETQR